MKIPQKIRMLSPRREEVLNVMADRHYPKGPRRFIFIYGVLLWGIPMFCVMTGLEWFHHPIRLEGVWLVSWLIFSLGLWCLAGYGFGWVQWRKIERRALRRYQQ
jgi:hypothetical protein